MNASIEKNPFRNHRMPFRMLLFISIMRLVFKFLGWLSPRRAGQLALRFFLAPPRFSTPSSEQSVCESASLHYLEIKNYKIAVRSWGEGPVVVLSHGWGGRGTQFFAFVEPLLAAGYRVVTFDAPAHGDSSGKQTTMMDVSEVLAAVVKNEGPIAALIGHSFGSGTALLAIERCRLSVDKVILFSCFADVFWITEKFGQIFGMSRRVIEVMRKQALQRFKNTYSSPWEWHQLSPTNTIKSFAGNLLLFHDKQDREIPYTHALQLSEIVPHAKLITTSKQGHRKILQNSTCIDQCIEFLAG